MPRQEAHLRRWQVAGIMALFLLNGAVAVIGFIIVTHQSARLSKTSGDVVEIRNAQIHALRQGAIASCKSRHKLAVVDIVALSESRAQSRAALRGPAAKVPGIRALLLRGLKSNARLLRLSHAADCPAPPHIPPSPKPRP